jgi:uracil-DNA glycosylase family 4
MSRVISLAAVHRNIVRCERCPRLRAYCRKVGRVKRAAYRHETYWAKPVPGFGDPHARILILGLAPAAHGANRTGRVFTGDGAGGSGDFLMAALNRAGLANLSTASRPDDGLVLRDAYIAAAVRCAPPQNKPLPGEIDACLDHLAAEVACLPRLETVVALGRVAWDAWLKLVERWGVAIPRPKPAFGHGALCTLGPPSLARLENASFGGAGTLGLVGCYHPSRQNTHTGKVTPEMYDAIFKKLAR